jgi:hypothetical protein
LKSFKLRNIVDPKYEFFARADMIKEYDKNSGMMSMIPIRISLIEECAANEATEIRVLNVLLKN